MVTSITVNMEYPWSFSINQWLNICFILNVSIQYKNYSHLLMINDNILFYILFFLQIKVLINFSFFLGAYLRLDKTEKIINNN